MKHYDIYYYNDIDLSISTIVLSHEKKCPPGWSRNEKNGRPHYGLVYVLDGSAVYYMEGRKFSVQKHDILYLPKDSTYLTCGGTADPYHFIVVNFLIADADDGLFESLPIEQVTKTANYAYYGDMFRSLANTWFYKGIAHKIKCKVLLEDILYHLLFDSIQNELHTQNLPKIQAAVSYMENCYYKKITVEELAEMVKLSISHFRRLFKNIFGISPLEYLNTIRINKARDLILTGMYSVAEVAEKVGYTNIYYFSRTFKKHTGKNPTAFKSGC